MVPTSRRAGPVSPVSRALAKDRLGVWPIVSMIGGAIAPLTVVAGGATTGWAVTGIVGIPLSYAVVGVALVVFSIGYVAMSRQIVNAGAFYTYVTHGLGRIPGVGAAMVAVLAYNTMQVGLYGGFGAVAAPFLATTFGVSMPWWAWALAAWLLVTVLGALRIELVGKILAVLLLAEVIVAAVFAVIQVDHPAGGTLSFAALSPTQLGAAGFGAALVTAVTGFVGFESAAVYSEESKQPRRTVPMATYLALILIGVVYTGCAWAMSVAAGPDKIVAASRAQGTELMFTLVRPYVDQAVLDLGHALFLTSLFAALLAFHNTAARYFFALGREGVLPRGLARTSAATRAPLAASLTQSLIGFTVIAVYALAGWDPLVQLFFWITVTGGLGVLILMVATSLAIAVYFLPDRRRQTVGAGRGVIAPLLSTGVLAWILVLTLQSFPVLLGVDPHSPWRWIFPAGYLVAAVGGMLWAGLLKGSRPGIYAGIGAGANSLLPTPADLTRVPAAHSGRIA